MFMSSLIVGALSVIPRQECDREILHNSVAVEPASDQCWTWEHRSLTALIKDKLPRFVHHEDDSDISRSGSYAGCNADPYPVGCAEGRSVEEATNG